MNYTIKGKNMDVKDPTKEKVSNKLDRLDKLFSDDTNVSVKISQEKIKFKVEVTIPLKKHVLRAEAKEEDLMAAVDKVVDILEQQTIKYKERLRKKVRQNHSYKEAYEAISYNDSNVPDIEENVIKITKNKSFEILPMDAEEAAMQMDLLGHSFFVFRDSKTDDLNVIYKRHDDSFGLISQE